MAEGAKTGRTIHVQRNQFHLAWDHSIPPLATIQSGEVVEFDLLDAAGGQIGPDSTVEAIETLDFARVDQVNGPIYVEGAQPGHTLQIDILDLQPANWGWTAIIPGFGLLADEFSTAALKIWHLEGGAEGWAEFAPGIRIPLAPFCGEMGLAPAAAGAHS
ncbi:MAG: acetamidase/formamidase family protein, partial [Ktedonobacteraceae bacterium]|nr:acetamidase/formamidase family protein [Ktedonobacteraceae bacterium]